MSDPIIKISMAGPSRVGKTSLITTVLSQSQSLFAGTKVSMRAGDTPTEARINDNRSDLKACLAQRVNFEASTLGGTQEETEYKLVMSLPGAQLRMTILDFPGGWLRPAQRPAGDGWEKCLAWLEDSPILLIPIEATLVMEAMTNHTETQRTIRELALAEVEDMARAWAKGRNARGEDGLVIFAPMKCEHYFPTNGGTQNLGDELFRRSMEKNVYGGPLKVIREETKEGTSRINVEYHPIGTLGCVNFTGGRWDDNGHFHAKYRKRKSAEWLPYGGDGILISIARFLASQEKSKARGFWEELGRWFSGIGTELDAVVKDLASRKDPPLMRKLP